ncbi:MAG: CHAP domain-containing protein [Deltaproteobacteria bacterium]|nr:CHAP domain-containing protein [Deltaproteobacteria bacterium]
MQNNTKTTITTLALAALGMLGCVNDVIDEAELAELTETTEIVNPSGEEEQALTVPSCGTVLQTFDGTAARSNGQYSGTGTACAGTGGVAGGLQYQCVELVMRHFKTKWNLRWYGNAKTLLDGAPRSDVNVYLNGDAAHPPVPGDMVVWKTGTWGHVALVTAVGSTFVDVIEQNVSNSNGKARLPYDGRRIGARWGSWVPAGWAHAKANTATGGGGGDTSSCGKLGAVGGTIDDDNDCFDVGGTPAWLHASTDQGYGSDLVWTHASAAAEADNSVTWRLDMARAGTYRLDVFIDADVAEATQASYRVRHAGVVDTIAMDQSARGGWRTLGDFRFATGAEQRVYLGDNTGERGALERKLVFDALRVTPVCATLKVTTGGDAPLNVRAQPDATSTRRGELSSDVVVERLDTVNGQVIEGTSAWHEIRQGGLQGFVSGAYMACP